MPIDTSADPRLPLATLRRRLAALLYEALLLTALVFIASFALAPFVAPRSAASATLAIPSPAGRAVSFAALFALCGAYFVYSWSDGRRTLAMKTWKLALLTPGGAPLERQRALRRYAASWIGPALALACYALLAPLGFGGLAWPLATLNWWAALIDPDGQFLHDRLAGTRLVASR